MIGWIAGWFRSQAEVAKRLEEASKSLERSIGKLDMIVSQAVQASTDEAKEKSASLRKDLDRLSD